MRMVKTGGWTLGLGLFALVISGCGGGSGAAIDSTTTAISGTITIESGTRVDSDTADDSRLGMAVANNTDSTAQDLPDAAVTGGYVSATSGRYLSDGTFSFVYPVDNRDNFRMRLADGARVVVQVFQSDESTGDPSIRLSIRNNAGDEECGGTDACSGAGSPVLTSTINSTSTALESYIVSVIADSGGPVRYVLTVTQSGSATTSLSAGYDQVEFVPNEAIVRLGAGAQTVQASAASGVVQSLGVSSARALGRGFWQLSRVPASIARSLSGTARTQSQEDTLAWIRDLRKRADVGLAEPNYLYKAQQITPDNDPLYARQWHYPLINLPLAWQLASTGGLGVGVAVMDTGLFSSTPDTYGNWHPDLEANVVGNSSGRILDYVTGELDIDNSPGTRDTNPADPGDGQPQASSFHGTHVAGTIAAVDNSIGGIGVAPSATLIPVRVLGQAGTGTGADLIDALNWASTQSDIDVINLSLGGLGPSTALSAAIEAAYNQGKLVVAAAGNQGTDSLTYPAAYAHVVGVGAVDGAASRASYSNYGGSVDLVAPGGDATRDANLDGNADVVISTWGDDSGGTFVPAYAGLQGTSMAAPHVTGVYALMKSAKPSLTPAEFFALLKSGDLTDVVGSQTEYGAGLINAVKAISAAQSGVIATTLVVSPTALQFRQEYVSQSLDLMEYSASGSATLSSSSKAQLTAVSKKPDWLTLEPADAAGIQNAGSVSASLVPGALTENVLYQGSIEMTYDTDSQTGRTLTIPVTAQLGEQVEARDAGRHYVLLVSADADRTTLKQQEVSAQDGQYAFRFAPVDPGTYFLVAGSDADNNGFICENGEACAEYPVNGLPETITISDQSQNGLVINTSFRRPTVTSMGLPRTGFDGYRLLSPAGASDTPNHSLRSEP